MKPILLILFALSIIPGCIEGENESTDVYAKVTNPTEKQSLFVKQNMEKHIKRNKPSSQNGKKQASTSDKHHSFWGEYQVIAENNLF